MLTAESILNAPDLSDLEKVDVPEWGGEVYVRVMNGIERDRWELAAMANVKSLNNQNIRAALCVICICDENGKRLFKDEDATKLGEKSSLALSRIFEAARKVNKLSDTDLEELEKN